MVTLHDDNSLKKWAYILPEMLCSRVTDVLMVMNHEDWILQINISLAAKIIKFIILTVWESIYRSSKG